jgi:hypothetical protein
MSARRLGIISSGSLILGFAAGWFLHQLAQSLSPVPGAVASTLATPAAAPAASPTKADGASARVTQSAATDVPTYKEHLATLRWLKASGLLPYTGFFQYDKLTSQFALLYGLTPPETAQLNTAALQAKQRLDELYRQRVRLDPSSGPEKLVVTIPALPEEGGKIYNDLLAQVSAVLGPDRYALFDEISGNALDSSFDGFGLTRHRYEVVPVTEPDGRLSYKLTGAYVYDAINYRAGSDSSFPSGTASGSFTTTGDAASLIKNHPVLKSFSFPTVPPTSAK